MKERIVKSSLSLFWRYGIKSVTMDDIAKELGISKRTIYQHFKDKNEIVETVISEELCKQTCEFEELEAKAVNPIDEMVHISAHIRESLCNMNPALLYDLKKYHPEGFQLFSQFKQSMVLQSVKDNLLKGQEEGFYRRDINVEILSRLRVEQIEMAFDPTIFPFGQYTMVDVQLQFLNHFVRGILTPKGFNYYNIVEKTAIEPNTHEK
ncbi:TetR/AcrR family transcriptional regulator [Dyadobacter tibetensis]|uniref:TetR/AcrR family transcriptional regulator n=1 Tax=Dyadobacter tibetensis TaxID=1211851 RepID=UPI000472B825|nr:TetR/AcrR family transcriptional regulator [Dyadobacter tibetensis]